MDISEITVPAIGNNTPIQWVGYLVLLDTVERPTTPDLSPRGSNFPSSPMTQWVNRGQRVNIFSDDDMEVNAVTDRSFADVETHGETQVVHAGLPNISENAAVIDADALADAWDSLSEEDPHPMEETAPHSGLVVDANVLAGAWSSSDEEGQAGIDVEALAVAWDSEGSASTRQGDTGQVATQSRQEATVDVAQLAAVWSSSDEDSDEESALPTSSSGESDNVTMALVL